MKREWRKTGSGQPVELRSEEVQELMGVGPGLDRLMVCDPPVSPEVQTAIHSTELRLIVQIHSTFSRKRQDNPFFYKCYVMNYNRKTASN